MFTLTPGGKPTIVFISQLGTGGDSWQPVLDRLTTGAATFTYDRPDTGNRPPRPAPNPPITYSVFAAELAADLDEAGVEDPLLLVGHSVGSLIARMFTHQYPDRVVGVVHVDGSIPRMTLFPASPPSEPPVDGDGPEATAIDCAVGEVEILEALTPSVPAMVVTRTPGRWLDPWVPERVDPVWTAYQRQLARQLKCPLVVADDAGHQIPAEQPGLVAYAVDEVVRKARKARSADGADRDSLRVAGGTVDGVYREDLKFTSTQHGKNWARSAMQGAKAKRSMRDDNGGQQSAG